MYTNPFFLRYLTVVPFQKYFVRSDALLQIWSHTHTHTHIYIVKYSYERNVCTYSESILMKGLI